MANKTALGTIKSRVMRVARLDAAGATPAGASNMYVTDALVELTAAEEVQEGKDFGTQNANGDYCIDYKDDPRVRWLNLTLKLCTPDAQLFEMIAGAGLLTTPPDDVGFQYPALGKVAPGNGVSLELWSWNISGQAQDGAFPWRRWALPKTLSWRLNGRKWSNDPMENELVGRAVENLGWGNGPTNDWNFDSSKVIQSIVTATPPPAAVAGYQATPAQV